MEWKVHLEVLDNGAQAGHTRTFAVKAKTAAMALEKAAQQARCLGLQPIGVHSCNPLVTLAVINCGWAGSQIA